MAATLRGLALPPSAVVLSVLGKSLIGLYLGRSGVAAGFGAAESLVGRLLP